MEVLSHRRVSVQHMYGVCILQKIKKYDHKVNVPSFGNSYKMYKCLEHQRHVWPSKWQISLQGLLLLFLCTKAHTWMKQVSLWIFHLGHFKPFKSATSSIKELSPNIHTLVSLIYTVQFSDFQYHYLGKANCWSYNLCY